MNKKTNGFSPDNEYLSDLSPTASLTGLKKDRTEKEPVITSLSSLMNDSPIHPETQNDTELNQHNNLDQNAQINFKNIDFNTNHEPLLVLEPTFITSSEHNLAATKTNKSVKSVRKRHSISSYISIHSSSEFNRSQSVGCRPSIFRARSQRKSKNSNGGVADSSIKSPDQQQCGTTNTNKHSSFNSTSGAHANTDNINTKDNEPNYHKTDFPSLGPTHSLSKSMKKARRMSLPSWSSVKGFHKHHDDSDNKLKYEKRASLSFLDVAKLDFDQAGDFESSVLHELDGDNKTENQKSKDDYLKSVLNPVEEDDDILNAVLNTVEEEEEEEDQTTYIDYSTLFSRNKQSAYGENAEFLDYQNLITDADMLDDSRSLSSNEPVTPPNAPVMNPVDNKNKSIVSGPLIFDSSYVPESNNQVPQTPIHTTAPTKHLEINSPLAVCSANSQPPKRQQKHTLHNSSSNSPLKRFRQLFSNLFHSHSDAPPKPPVVGGGTDHLASGRPPYSQTPVGDSLIQPAPKDTKPIDTSNDKTFDSEDLFIPCPNPSNRLSSTSAQMASNRRSLINSTSPTDSQYYSGALTMPKDSVASPKAVSSNNKSTPITTSSHFQDSKPGLSLLSKGSLGRLVNSKLRRSAPSAANKNKPQSNSAAVVINDESDGLWDPFETSNNESDEEYVVELEQAREKYNKMKGIDGSQESSYGYTEWKKTRRGWTGTDPSLKKNDRVDDDILQPFDSLENSESQNKAQYNQFVSSLDNVPESSYPSIYKMLVQDKRPLKKPMPLADALVVIKSGWVSTN